MLLALDIGNSHVVCAVNNSNKWIKNIRISSNLDSWNKFKTLKEYDITHAAISSVVPKLTSVYVESIWNIFHIDTFIITHKNSGVKLNVKVPKVIFSTYQSSPLIAESQSEIKNTMFDLMIADEAHKCTGDAGSLFTTC